MNALTTVMIASSALVPMSCAGSGSKPMDSSKAIPEEQAPASTMAARSVEAGDAAKPTVKQIPHESADDIESCADLMEGRSFESITLASRLTLPAQCRKPGRKVPAVIIQHGSGAPRHRWYRELPKALDQAGIAALVADSYTAREVGSTACDQTRLSRANRVYDAFSAFRALAAIPCIDPDRIGITGYSSGGIVSPNVAESVVESVIAERLGAGHAFKASLPVYPGCQSQRDASQPTSTGVHFLLAELDDCTPARYCKATANRKAAP